MISKSKKKFILPKHVAIIMDGNNRWTKKHKLKGFKGHEKGIDAIQNAVDASKLYNIKFLTLFSFSSENWTRPKNEVNFLMNLLRKYLKNKIEDLMKDNISIKMIGDKKKLPKDIVKKINFYEKRTEKNTSLNLIFALNYGSRNEITIAVKDIVKKFITKKIKINEESISSHLFTKNFPDPDLLIRTSGEKRLSNFLLWQLAYTELVFLDVLWPDFKKRHFVESLNQYSKRVRRYGSR
ncbi:MAG: Isoprenyl transferase [Alphaproteobacteria bacterium MarineAlpha6_Bin6]|nr:MAG: Isoprenyl transferase [Alphaproteobacteria bacterium MarineAlpha6_Bin6]PPR32962.1 MAG: Isoprenyl transferase [Alphaproteobacteria bacterium MarineAlpha6_Bin5]|tara:strand:+ start:27312 stop:28025 length:714 start_codon:yes stop_codon:yes gene_type:complete